METTYTLVGAVIQTARLWTSDIRRPEARGLRCKG
jgi:hypothetical protein